ncbi:hypothetical protein ANCDUO_20326, partial [Ancylostoma duodenale]
MNIGPEDRGNEDVGEDMMAGLIVAIVEFFLVILSVYGLFRNFHLFGSSYLFWFILGIFSVIVIILAIVLMLYAIKKEKARWLIPHLSAQANSVRVKCRGFEKRSGGVDHTDNWRLLFPC